MATEPTTAATQEVEKTEPVAEVKTAAQTTDERIEVSKVELDKLKKQANREGYTSRQVSKLEARIAELEKSKKDEEPGDEEDAATLRQKVYDERKARHALEQSIKEREAKEALTSAIATYMTEDGLEASVFDNVKTPEDARLAAADAVRARAKIVAKMPTRGVDRGGGSPTGAYVPTAEEIRKASVDEYQQNVKSGKWIMRRSK